MILALNSKAVEGHVADAGRLNDAAGWHARLHNEGASEATWLEFAAWLETNDDNRAAFDLVEDLYFALEDAEPHLTPAIEVARSSRVVRLGAPAPARFFPVRAGMIGLSLVAATLLVAVVIGSGGDRAHIERYATAIGEKRTVNLADGSMVELNTGSAITVSFSRDSRKISLDKGEAAFRVGKDAARPFIVTVGDRDVRDIGTIFNVLNASGRIVVTVAAGRVAVSPHGMSGVDANANLVSLAAGDQLLVQPGHTDAVRRIDPAIAMAWREGYLTYQEAPLSTVVDDLNRYFPNRIVLRDSATAARSFSGALKVDDPDAVVAGLAQLLPLAIDRAGDGVITLRLKTQKD